MASKKAVLPTLAQAALGMQNMVVVAGRNLDGSEMDSYDSILGAGVEQLAGRFASRHILEIIAMLRTVLDDAVMRAHTTQDRLGKQGEQVPFMEEFLACFPRDRARMLSKNHYGWY